MTRREEGEEEKIKEDGRREEERSSRRAGRINKRGAPPSHLRHLYFAAPHGRKSSSVSERRDTMWRGEVCEQKGRQGVPVPRVQDHGHLPRARAQHSSLTLPWTYTSPIMITEASKIVKPGDESARVTFF